MLNINRVERPAILRVAHQGYRTAQARAIQEARITAFGWVVVIVLAFGFVGAHEVRDMYTANSLQSIQNDLRAMAAYTDPTVSGDIDRGAYVEQPTMPAVRLQ